MPHHNAWPHMSSPVSERQQKMRFLPACAASLEIASELTGSCCLAGAEPDLGARSGPDRGGVRAADWRVRAWRALGPGAGSAGQHVAGAHRPAGEHAGSRAALLQVCSLAGEDLDPTQCAAAAMPTSILLVYAWTPCLSSTW